MTQNLELNLPSELHQALIEFAQEADIPLSIYIEIALAGHVKARVKARLTATWPPKTEKRTRSSGTKPKTIN
jgi:hypothetical protein